MKKYENFVRSLKNLKDIYQYEPPYGNVEMTGIVGLFEVCFEHLQLRKNTTCFSFVSFVK